MTAYIIHSGNYHHYDSKDLGGKAKNLFYLESQGLAVPAFICLSAQAFKAAMYQVIDQVHMLLDCCDYTDIKHVMTTAERLQELVLQSNIPDDVSAELTRQLDNLSTWKHFSVRSSATNEDGMNHSFAGQLGTWLNVSITDIQDKIKACWASAFAPGILTYMHKMDCHPVSNQVSVIIQRMVQAESSGVMFQADPRGGTDRQLIAAGYGLGEGIVADKVETDLYTYDKIANQWSLDINEKHRRLDYHPNGGTCEQAIDKSLGTQAVLNEHQRHQLLTQSKKIASLYTHYQDIEWAFDQQGALFILQSRPITTIPRGQDRVFDNSNIIESYPGVVLPMTFSLLSLDYYHCVKDAMLRCGAPRSVIHQRDALLQHLVGYINGRTYYNISNWYKALSLVPFFKKRIIRYFEEMIGTEGSFSENLTDQTLSLWQKAKIAAVFPTKFIWNLLGHKRLIKTYFRKATEIKQAFEAIDIDKASADELIGQLHQSVNRFMPLLSIPILNDFFAMIFMAVTRESIQKYSGDTAGALLNRLLADQKIDSTLPVMSVNQLIDQVSQDPALLQALKDIVDNDQLNDPDKIATALKNQGFVTFQTAFITHLDNYGYRSPRELIMEADTFRENPFQLIRLITQATQSSSVTHKPIDDVNAEWQALLSKAKYPRLLSWLVAKTRETVAHREATRLDRGLHFSIFRVLLHAIGKKLQEENVIKHPRDIFYITLQELDDYRQGCSVNQDLSQLVNYRKTMANQWSTLKPDSRLFTRGTAYANPFNEKARPAASESALVGVGCSSGEITAEALVVTNPNEASDVKGKILVSETTDPGWVFLMTQSAGLISERGSLLSHTAIIGRELGIPTIVAVKHATDYIQDGDQLCMNGKTGKITLLKQTAESHHSDKSEEA